MVRLSDFSAPTHDASLICISAIIQSVLRPQAAEAGFDDLQRDISGLGIEQWNCMHVAKLKHCFRSSAYTVSIFIYLRCDILP